MTGHDDGATAGGPRRRHGGRHGRAAARRRRGRRRGRGAGGPPAPGDRDLPRRRGKAGGSTAPKRSGARSCGRRSTLGAEFVDVEWRAGFDDRDRARSAARRACRRTTSPACPSIWTTGSRAMRRPAPASIKIAVTPRRVSPTRCRCATSARAGDAVVIGMGDAGLPSRLLAARFGSRWTYAGQRRRAGADSGGADASTSSGFARDRPRDAALRRGRARNAMHSLSPAMHNAAFAARGHRRGLRAAAAADFDDFLAFADALGIDGASVTIPFKLDALRGRGDVRPIARATVGAANTLRRTGAGWEATNTDVDGLPRAARRRVRRRAARQRARRCSAPAASARAVVVALASRGATVTRARAARGAGARRWRRRSARASAPWPPAAGSWDLLVNCTPLGGADRRATSRRCRMDRSTAALVYDLTYGDGESRAAARGARSAGCATLDGLPMLVAQAERQFEWWTGQRPAGRRDARRRRLPRRGRTAAWTRHE